MHLGATIATAFSLALAVRKPLRDRFVRAVDEALQPRRQFMLDLTLSMAAGLLVTVFNGIAHHFPAASAFSLLFGCLVAGFFMGLDTALARERRLITRAQQKTPARRPPKRLYPVTRKFTLVAFSTSIFICLILMMVISRDFAWLAGEGQGAESLKMAETTVLIEVIFIMTVLLGMVLNLIVSYSRNLKLLFDNETEVLEQVSRGDLSRMVPVVTQDEFGLIAGHTNTMIEGLRHRTQMMTALKLAEEVQQSLLPKSPPRLPGGEVVGTSRYCDETGGDYYDFFPLPGDRLGIVVADASDHGVGSALHVAAARAFLLSSADAYAGAAQLVSRVNRFLTRDHRETGRFITLFFLEIHPQQRTLKWVRAGHEPAFLYEPRADRMTELAGEGMALGVVDTYDFTVYKRNGWERGSLVLIGTDGIRETRNRQGTLFGWDRIGELLRAHGRKPATVVQERIMAALDDFRGDQPQEDDVTLVVVRLP